MCHGSSQSQAPIWLSLYSQYSPGDFYRLVDGAPSWFPFHLGFISGAKDLSKHPAVRAGAARFDRHALLDGPGNNGTAALRIDLWASTNNVYHQAGWRNSTKNTMLLCGPKCLRKLGWKINEAPLFYWMGMCSTMFHKIRATLYNIA